MTALAPMMAAAPDMAISPMPQANQVDVVGQRSRQETARIVLEGHKAGLMARRGDDLLREKFMLHIDGNGDNQWADIYRDQKVEIPPGVSEFHKTENVLRLVVDNAVAHHTTMPLLYFVESLTDRRARERALVDMLWMRHVAEQQDLNGLFADALYMAMGSGFCPVHRYWRDDAADQYETLQGDGQAMSMGGAAPGMIDCWVGNPFDTVFDRSARRGSVRWASYGRILSAAMIRQKFGHLGREVESLEGTSRLPSASQFQRMARDWRIEGLAMHGSSALQERRSEGRDEELIVVVCRETLPGVDARWPEGRLHLIAVPGASDLRRGTGQTSQAVLLADQPLPAADFSWTNFYSHFRGDDVHGKPWVEDLDPLQIDLNIAISKHWEFVNRAMEAPIILPGGAIGDDMLNLDGYNIIEMDPAVASSARPRVMDYSPWIAQSLEKVADQKRRAIFTGGGYQAVSRGESPGSRMAYRAIVALQQADNSIHGPVNMRFRRSAIDFAAGCWRQMKVYGDVPWLINIAGDEYAHLAATYIDNTKLSTTVPKYKLVNAFGPSPELRAQEVLELMTARGADGEPFLRTAEARRAYPNPMIFDTAGDPGAVARRRAKTVAAKFHELTGQFRATTGFQGDDPNDPALQQLALQLFMVMETKYPRLRDDDLNAHIASLSEITQDETADPIARLAAMKRQDLYYQWQQAMALTPGMPGPAGPGQPGQKQLGNPAVDRRAIAAQSMGGGEEQENDSDAVVASTARG